MNDDLLYSNRFVQKPDVDEADTARQIQTLLISKIY